ncbi:glycerophosphodiester phosphodiesterase [Paenibacillus guangzhouensis]|uniref:glycerophosphodiester phosphodiesterase n=1 Tax=Paenibacillus guangzhouensis TaxID=1473112 RepID=UPI001266A5C9|nr:glycerophosphodiester phosphodiesterase [Paenibacillus guangzhouensis]
MSQSTFLIAAHTGSGSAPDNTMASFLEGIRCGADIVEVDVRATKDGMAILLHDDSPLLQAYSYEQLNTPAIRMQLDAIYAHHEIVRLEEIFAIAKQYPVRLNLDLKDQRSLEPAFAAIERAQAFDRVYLTGCTEGMTQRHPQLGVLMNTPDFLTEEEVENYDVFADEICARAREEGYTGLNMAFYTCREAMVERAHACGLVVWVYTVNDPYEMAEYIAMGVDAITTRNVSSLLGLK